MNEIWLECTGQETRLHILHEREHDVLFAASKYESSFHIDKKC